MRYTSYSKMILTGDQFESLLRTPCDLLLPPRAWPPRVLMLDQEMTALHLLRPSVAALLGNSRFVRLIPLTLLGVYVQEIVLACSTSPDITETDDEII